MIQDIIVIATLHDKLCWSFSSKCAKEFGFHFLISNSVLRGFLWFIIRDCKWYLK